MTAVDVERARSVVTAAGENVRSVERDLEAARRALGESLVDAQRSGASIPDLVEWSGVSRRTVHYAIARVRRPV